MPLQASSDLGSKLLSLMGKKKGLLLGELVQKSGANHSAIRDPARVVTVAQTKRAGRNARNDEVIHLQFWKGAAEFPPQVPPEVRLTEAALPRRLGKFPFWSGTVELHEFLDGVYARASAYAAGVLQGNRNEVGH
jgi:uncharacterized Zn finger protein